MRPLSMMPTRSASSSASSRYCVVRKIVMPSSGLSRRTSAHTLARLTGSSPVVGSSRNRTSGLCTSAAARSSRRSHAPGVGGDPPVEGVGEVDQLAQLGDPVPSSRSSAGRRARPGVAAARRRSAWGRGRPPAGRRRCGAAPSPGWVATSYPATVARPPDRREQRAQHAHGRGLARAVRAEEPVDLATRDVEVDPVDRGQPVERAHEALGPHGRGGGRTVSGPGVRLVVVGSWSSGWSYAERMFDERSGRRGRPARGR